VIVVTVLPLIVGGLAIGLMSVLSLNSTVSTRLGNSEDSQVVQSTFRNDVQSASYITTDPTAQGICGTGHQVLGLEWNQNAATDVYQTVVSYVSVPVTRGSTTTYSLIRQECDNVQNNIGTITSVTSSTVVSTNLSANSANLTNQAAFVPTILPGASATAATSGWIPTAAIPASDAQSAQPGVSSVTWPITEPQGSTSYTYTLVASPPASDLPTIGGNPPTNSVQAGCGYAATGSGTYASSLCLVDFAGLSGNNMVAARQSCVELSIPLPGGSTLYFCILVNGAPVAPYALPTWTDGFLGNSINGVPFYSDVPGDPALYQSCEGSSSTCVVNGVSVPNTWQGVTTITLTHIAVVAPDNNPATGWEFVSADAESTDDSESITWTSDSQTGMFVIPNNQSVDTVSDPIGNACNSGNGVSGSYVTQTSSTPLTAAQVFSGNSGNGATTITCSGDSNGTKTGTLMVESEQPKSVTITMVGTGLEGISLGLLF
jgi:hypothetical protein